MDILSDLTLPGGLAQGLVASHPGPNLQQWRKIGSVPPISDPSQSVPSTPLV
jgi:hypothetical protein